MLKNKFFGLSLNDRLTRSSLTRAFSHAVKSRDASHMSQILTQIDYPQDSAKATIKTFLHNPSAFKK